VVSVIVLIDLETLDTKTSPATGKVYFRFGDIDFPDGDWSDFVVRVVGWWLEDVTKLIEEGVGVILRFMDGPFAVRLEPSTQLDRWRATAQYHDAPLRELPEGMEVDSTALTVSLREAGRALLAECNRRGVESRDVKNLATALDAFELAASSI